MNAIRHLLLAFALNLALACAQEPDSLANSPADTLPASVMNWVAAQKAVGAKNGAEKVSLSVEAVNVSSEAVQITRISPSCDCAVVNAPKLPWRIAPEAKAVINLEIDLRGKRGFLAKHVTVETSHGRKVLAFRVNIGGDGKQLPPVAEFRAQNLKIAAGDAQAIFKGTCANCHASPARGRMGRELYQAACAICHNSPNRAEMVPALETLPQPTSPAFWKQSISAGKPGTLMPAFAVDQGGPLTPEQVASLAKFLSETIPPNPKAPPSPSK